MKDKRINITVRDIDPELWREARAAAVIAKKNLGEWLNEVIKEKLQRNDKGN